MSHPLSPADDIAPLPNALDPNLMTASERLTEIGEILAAGLLRLRAKEREKATAESFPWTSLAAGASHGRKARDRERP